MTIDILHSILEAVKDEFELAGLDVVDWDADATVLKIRYYTRPSCSDGAPSCSEGAPSMEDHNLRPVEHLICHIPHDNAAPCTTIRRVPSRPTGQEAALDHPQPHPPVLAFPADSLPDLCIPATCFVSLLGLDLSDAELDLLLKHIRTTDLVISGPELLSELRLQLGWARQAMAEAAAAA